MAKLKKDDVEDDGKKEVAVDSESMKVSWSDKDVDPVPSSRPVRLIRLYSNVDNRQLKVMRTVDAEDCLHIYLDVV